MNRELAKKKAMSRDCHCVKGKDRDNNYNSIIDEIFDWHESEVKKLSIHSVSQQRELLIAYAKFENGNNKLYACDESNIDEFISN